MQKRKIYIIILAKSQEKVYNKIKSSLLRVK